MNIQVRQKIISKFFKALFDDEMTSILRMSKAFYIVRNHILLDDLNFREKQVNIYTAQKKVSFGEPIEEIDINISEEEFQIVLDLLEKYKAGRIDKLFFNLARITDENRSCSE